MGYFDHAPMESTAPARRSFDVPPEEETRKNYFDHAPDEGQAAIGNASVEPGKAILRGAIGGVATGIRGAAASQEVARADRTRMFQDTLDYFKQIDEGKQVTGEGISDPDVFAMVEEYKQAPPEAREQLRKAREAQVKLHPARDVRDTELFKLGKQLGDWNQEKLRAAKDWEGSLTNQLFEAGGTTIPFFATGLLPGGILVATGAGAQMSAGEAVDRAIQKGATKDQILQAVNLGILPGLTETAPVEAWLAKIPLPAMGKVMQAVIKVGSVALAEGGQEGFQQAMQNIIAKYTYDPKQDIMQDVWKSAAIGATVGAAIATPTAPFMTEDQKQPAPATQPPPPGAEAADTIIPPEEPPPGGPPAAATTVPGVTIVPAEQAPPAPAIQPRMVVDDPAFTDQSGTEYPAGELNGQTVKLLERGPDMSVIQTTDGQRRKIGNNLLKPATPLTSEPIDKAVTLAPAVEQKIADSLERPDSPRLTPDDRKSPIPNEIIDEGKRAIEQATGRESTFTTTTEINGKREVVSGNVSDLVASNRVKTQAVVSQIMEGVSPSPIVSQAMPAAAPAAAPEAAAIPVPTEAAAAVRPSVAAPEAAAAPEELPVDKPSLEEMVIALRAKQSARKEKVDTLVAAGQPVRMVATNAPGKRALVGPDVSEPGKYRITFLDEHGPSGHMVYDSFDKALDDAFIYNYDVESQVRPQSRSSTPINRNVMETAEAVTPAGRNVPVQYAVVDADDLVTSQTDDLTINPNYPAELQPRDRSRAASVQQINTIAQRLDPRLLDKMATATDGAPIVSEAGVVESGNGRVLGIRKAYNEDLPGAAVYRDYLESQGYPVGNIKRPVLVRIRQGDMPLAERTAFTREANERTTLGMAATERAMADAAAIDEGLIGLYRGGDVDQAGNREFVKGFMQKVVGPTEQAAMLGPTGEMSQEAIRRLEGALLAKAYGDPDLVSTLIESPDTNIKAIGGAMMDVAGQWAQMRSEAKDGTINPDADATERLLEAVRLVQRARKEGRPLFEYVNQRDVFSGSTIHPVAEAFLRLMFRNDASWTQPVGREKLAEALNFYVTESRKTSAGTDLLGETAPPPGKILEEAKKRQYAGQPAQPKLEAKPKPEEKPKFAIAGRTAGKDAGVSGQGRAVEAQPRAQAEERAGAAREARQAPEVAERQPGETDKEFAKRVVDKRPEPKALPEKYDDYFIMKGAEVVPIGALVSSKTDEENRQGGTNAAKRMEAAAKGELAKRKPITVERMADGKYLILDGNGTYTSVKGYGWKSMPVMVEGAVVNPAAPVPAEPHPTSFTGETATPEQMEPFYRHPYKTIDAIYEDAQARQDELGAAGKEIASGIEGVEFVNPGLKSKAKSTGKIPLKGYKDAGQISDAIRGGFHVTQPGQASQIIRALARHFEVLDENWSVTPQGYFDRKALVKFADGRVGEVQFWEPHVFHAKEVGYPAVADGVKGHDLYDDHNKITDKTSPRAVELNRQMNELYAYALSLAEARAWATVLSEGKLSKPEPKYLNLLRQTSSSMTRQELQTSEKSASTQSVEPGSRSALASQSEKTTGRLSQLQNFTKTTSFPDNNVVQPTEEVKATPKAKVGTGKRPSGEAETQQVVGGQIHYALSEQFRAVADKVTRELRSELDRLGLTGVNLKVWQQIFADLEHGAFGVDGLYLRNMIDIALNATNKLVVLHHEALHAMRALKVFTDTEWSILERKSKKDWVTDEIKANYPEDQWVEEGIAFAFQKWMNGGRMDGVIAKSFKKIDLFMKALYKTLTGNDIRSAEDIFHQISTGEIGGRSQGKPAPRTAAEAKAAATETVETEVGPAEQYVIPGAEKLTQKQLLERAAQGRKQAARPQKGLEGLSLFDEPSEQMSLFKISESKSTSVESRGDDPTAPRFKLRTPPGSQTQASQVQQGFLNRGQPVDRAIRLPLQLFGGLDAQGRWVPGKRLSEKVGPAGRQGAAIGGVIGAGVGTIVAGPGFGTAVGAAIGGTAGGLILGTSPNPKGKFGWFAGLAENAKRGLIDGYGLDPAYVEAYRKSELGKISIEREAQGILKVLSNAGVGTSESAVLQQILTGKQVNDADMTRLAVPIRKAIDDLGAEAVSLGLISAESFERNRGAYLHRVYQKHEVDAGTLPGWISKTMAKRRKKIIGDQMKGRGMFWDVPVDRLMQDVESFQKGQRGTPQLGEKFRVIDEVSSAKDIATGEVNEKTLRRVYLPANEAIPAKYQGANWTDRGTWEVRKAGKTTTLWRDYSEAERSKMGELVDARYTIAKTFMLMANDLSTGRFFKEVSEKEEWTKSAPPPDGKWKDASEYSRYWNDPEIGWVKVPDTTIDQTGGKKRWGALAGKYVRSEIWRDLNEVDIAQRPGTWRTLLTQWKKNKTARNPVVHMNNVMSNLTFMDIADVRMQDLAAGIKAYTKGSADFIEARDNGAFGSDMVSAEIRNEVLKPILDEIAKQTTGAKNPFLARAGALGAIADRVWTWAKTADNGMLRAYQIEDEVFRMATYMRRRSQGESPQVAAMNARDQFLNYDIRAPWVAAMRNSLFPFVSYTYRAVPKLMENIAHRPWKLAKYMTIAYAVNALAYMWGDDDEPPDEERERAALRDEEQGWTWFGIPRMVRMPWRDSNGLPVFLDVRRWIPAGDVFDSTQGSSAVPIPSPLHFGGPLQMAFEFMLNRQAFTGDDITSDLTMDNAEKISSVADWAWKSWAPASFWTPYSWYWTKIANAVYGATDTAGHPYSVSQALLSSFGIKVKPIDVEDGIKWHFYDFKKTQDALKKELRSNAYRLERGLISQSAHDSAQAALMEKNLQLGEKVKEFERRIRPKKKEGE